MQVKRLSRVKIDGGQARRKTTPLSQKNSSGKVFGPARLVDPEALHPIQRGGRRVFSISLQEGSKILSGICGHTRRSPDIGRESGPDARQFQSPVEKYGKISFKDISLQKALFPWPTGSIAASSKSI